MSRLPTGAVGQETTLTSRNDQKDSHYVIRGSGKYRVSPPYSDSTLNELSAVIGELRNFAIGQAATNTHILEELRKIVEKMGSLSEMGATFAEYRHVLHERFGKIHTQINDIDDRHEKLESKVDAQGEVIAAWKGQVRTLIYCVGIGGSIVSALASSYGGALLRILAHTP